MLRLITKKIIMSILFILLLSSSLNSCRTCSVGNEELEILGINLINIQLDDSNGNAERYTIEDGQSIDALEYQILIKPFATNNMEVSQQIQKNETFAILQSAQACDITLEFNDVVSNITITSNIEINEQYPVGSNLNELFKVVETQRYGYIISHNKTLTEFIDQSEKISDIYLQLNSELLSSSSHNFTINFELENGKTFNADTGIIHFN